MKISESSVKVWQCSRTKVEQGLGYAGPGAQRLGSTGTLGRRVYGTNGTRGRGLPADGLRRPRGAGRFESDLNVPFTPIKRRNIEQREPFDH